MIRPENVRHLFPAPAASVDVAAVPGARRITVDGREGVWVPADSVAVLITAIAAGLAGSQPEPPGAREVA